MNCPCSGRLVVVQKDGYQLCSGCGSFLSEPMDQAVYADDYWASRGTVSGHRELVTGDRLPWWLEHVMRHKPRRTLEIGCAPGALLDALLTRGVDAWGVDPSFAHGRSMKGFWPETQLPGYFDTVILLDILEHFPDPVKALEAIRTVVFEGAVLLIQTPTIRNDVAFEDRFFLPGEHVWVPTQVGLDLVLAQTGFRTTKADERWYPGHEWTEAEAV